MLDDISFVIHPREKVAFVGSDVVAKTTLLKSLWAKWSLTKANSNGVLQQHKAISRATTANILTV